MLNSIHVKNMAVIREEEIFFSKGLNILTGETGAGKSILLGSVNLALGAKADKTLIRGGCDQAVAELEFSVEDPEMEQQLQEQEIYPEAGILTLSRRILPNRSVARINGETVSQSILSGTASLLIDIHGQQDNRILLTSRNHRELLDTFGGRELQVHKAQVRECFARYTEARKTLESASMDTAQRARTMDLLQHEIREIEAADLKAGEDEELENTYRILVNGEKIAESVSQVQNYLEQDQGIRDMVTTALRELQYALRYDASLENLQEQLSSAASVLDDVEYGIRKYAEGLEFDPRELDHIQERLDMINHLKSRYGTTLESIESYLHERRKELESLENYEEYLEKLEECVKIAYDALVKECAILSRLRQAASAGFCSEVIRHMKELNFAAVEFECRLLPLETPTADGAEEVEFYVSLNPGEPLRSLTQAASGGELSRIMLSIKTVLSDKDDIPTLIFDEIDTGISGRTAAKVAEKLLQISQHRQVICITHLPQIAAAADRHFIIEKCVENGHSETHIRIADELESTAEIARMLGSDVVTDTALNNARELRNMSKRKVVL